MYRSVLQLQKSCVITSKCETRRIAVGSRTKISRMQEICQVGDWIRPNNGTMWFFSTLKLHFTMSIGFTWLYYSHRSLYVACTFSDEQRKKRRLINKNTFCFLLFVFILWVWYFRLSAGARHILFIRATQKWQVLVVLSRSVAPSCNRTSSKRWTIITVLKRIKNTNP